jgi:AcrR family transcriptional regulator
MVFASRDAEGSDPVVRRVAERSVLRARDRAQLEARALIDAGLAVLQRAGATGMTVGDVLAESGLSTRAFYRHFASKDELVLAVFESETRRNLDRQQAAVGSAMATAGPRRALEAWVDELLAVAFEPRRARRAQTFWAEGARLRSEFPVQFDAIVAGLIAPLVAILERGREDGTFALTDPAADARSIYAVVWALAERRLDGDTSVSRAQAREHALRFCLPALGAQPLGNRS